MQDVTDILFDSYVQNNGRGGTFHGGDYYGNGILTLVQEQSAKDKRKAFPINQ